MKGLEVAKDFFLNWGLSYLQEHYPDLTQGMSAGRFSGSDVLGADDDISRDHNWGPQFSLFLSRDDFDKFGEQLSERINNSAPSKWKGYWVDGAGDKNLLVECVPVWIEETTGFTKIPQADEDWGIIVKHRRMGGTVEGRESALFYLRQDTLWLDNNAEFAQWRKALAKYPDAVWYARLAGECFRLWQYGQYNFVQRIAKRNDPLATSLCLGEFIEGVMRLLLLLYENYTPYWKWLAYAFRRLDRAAHYAPMLDALITSNDSEAQSKLVMQICQDMYQEMLSVGVIEGEGEYNVTDYHMPMLMAQMELTSKAPWITQIV